MFIRIKGFRVDGVYGDLGFLSLSVRETQTFIRLPLSEKGLVFRVVCLGFGVCCLGLRNWGLGSRHPYTRDAEERPQTRSLTQQPDRPQSNDATPNP